MMRSINLATTNCLDYKYKNIYIYGKYIFVLRENVSKNEMVSILIEMTGEWGFFVFLFLQIVVFFSYEMMFWVSFF